MEALTYSQIKRKVGDTWALIYNPVYSDKTGKLEKGELVDFCTDKQKLLREVEKDKTKNLHFTIKWFGKVPEDNLLLNFF